MSPGPHALPPTQATLTHSGRMRRAEAGRPRAGWERELLGPALVLAGAVAVELVSRCVVRIPNPPALLLLLVVFAAFHGGLRSGLASAAVAWGYFTWAFSTPGDLFHYAPDDLKRVVIWGLVTPACAFMVGRLRTRAVAAERAASDEAEHRFTKAFHTSPVGVVLTRIADAALIDANASFLATIGYTADEIIGNTAVELGLWRSPAERAALMARLQAEGTIRGVEVAMRTKSGESVHFLASMAKVMVDHDECVLKFAVDLTEHRRAAEALRRRDEELVQTRKMEAIGRLAGGIAHDFNNLLTVIGGNASLLAQTVHDPDAVELVGEIAGASNRAVTLTRQLLAFSRQDPPRPTAVDVGAVVATLEPFLARTIGEHVVVATRLAPGLGSVLADPGELDQVVTNLVINARDAMPHGGTITISTRAATVDDGAAARLGRRARAGDFVVLAVRDTGDGIDAATVDRIFEPFFTTKRMGHGTGLGLATVYGIVTRANGFVTVDSAPGVGATFGVYLPRSGAPAPVPEAAPPAPLPRGHECILLVEDDAAVRSLTARLLIELGYTVLAPDSVRDALAVAAQHAAPIHLVLTDVVMPDMNGRELAERVAPMLPSAKILFFSGHASDARLAESIRAGTVALLPKPFSTEELARKVRDVLDGVAPRPAPASAAAPDPPGR